MTNSRVFIDMDDVLNVFTPYVLNYLGCDVETYDDYDPVWGWDIVGAATHYHPEINFTPQKFWGSLTRQVWGGAPLNPYADHILTVCEELFGRENIFILSAPARGGDCVAGKIDWIEKHMPRWIRRQFILTPAKHTVAQPGCWMIDDAEHNVDSFREHGGKALLVPRPWNRNWGMKDFMPNLRERLETGSEV